MGDTIAQNPKGEKGAAKKLDDLKGIVDEYKDYIPDSIENPLKENIEIAKKLFNAKELIDKYLDYVDVNIDLMEHLEEIKTVLQGLKSAAELIKKSSEVDYVLESIENFLYYLDVALSTIDLIVSKKISLPEKTKLKEKLKDSLTEISKFLDKAIAAIDFVQKLQKINLKDIGWDTLDQLKALIE